MPIIQCPYCGKSISDKAKKCVHCGKALVADNSLPQLLCSECGKKISYDVEECPYCGCPIEINLVNNNEKSVIPDMKHEKGLEAGKRLEENSEKTLIEEKSEEKIDEKHQNNSKLIISGVRYFVGCYIILMGLVLMSSNILSGFLFILAAILVFPVTWNRFIYERVPILGKEKHKKNVTVVLPIAIMFLAGVITSATTVEDDNQNNMDNEIEYQETIDVTEETTTVVEIAEIAQTEVAPTNFDCSWGIGRYSSNEYKYITEADFAQYYPNLNGVKVALVGTIDKRVESDKLYLQTENNGFMYTICNMLADYSEHSDELNGKQCMVIGTVAETKSYGFMGDSVQMNDCLVVAYGDEVLKYKKENSDSSLSQYFKVTENVANSSSTNVSESDFKNLCNVLPYDDVMRNPNNYKGKYCKVSGNVNQVIEGILNTVTIYVTDDSGNKWECVYTYNEDDSHILEGDYVTLYGKCKGTTKATTVLNKQVVLPYISVEYIK